MYVCATNSGHARVERSPSKKSPHTHTGMRQQIQPTTTRACIECAPGKARRVVLRTPPTPPTKAVRVSRDRSSFMFLVVRRRGQVAKQPTHSFSMQPTFSCAKHVLGPYGAGDHTHKHAQPRETRARFDTHARLFTASSTGWKYCQRGIVRR